jgi:Baseplate J-like protein
VSQGYIEYPIDSDPMDLLDEAYTNIKSRTPQWVENTANLDTWILQIVASEASGLYTLAQDVPDTIFKWYGANLIGLPPLDATPALVGSTWAMQDSQGYFIPAGTQVAIRDSSGVDHAFASLQDVVVPAGQTSTAAGGVTLQSIESGAALSGLGGAGYSPVLIDTLAYVTTVTLTGVSAGGQDAELSSQYNYRLARKLQRLSQRPVLASDYALASLDVTGVWRSVALDGFNPSDGTFNNQRMIGIAAVDQSGTPISAAIKANLDAYLQSMREVNFVVTVFDPTVTQIDVTYNVKCIVGYTTATVQANATAALQDYFNPAHWGEDPSVTDATAAAQTWVETPIVYYNKILNVLGQAQGVDRVLSMTMGIHGGALGTVDINLPGHACLTNPNTINGTATP